MASDRQGRDGGFMSTSAAPARHWVWIELLERRCLLSAAQDVTGLTALRLDASFSAVDGSGVGIAILDTGVFATHPDLRNNFSAFFDAVKNPATAAADTNINDAFDPNGHGTHVSGIAASSNPSIGVATAAKLIDVRVFPSAGDPQPLFDPVENGLDWVINHYQQFNIKVVNLSLGDPTANFNSLPAGDGISQAIDRLEQLGVSVVAAAGNNYANFAVAGATTPGVFATLDVANTWADSGTGVQFPLFEGSGTQLNFVAEETDAAPDRISASSQRSSLGNQVAAPGSNILSTWNLPNKLYNDESGTSMSSPFVTGVVALMQDAAFTYGGRYLSTTQVQSLLRNTADNITDSNVSSNFRVPVQFDANGVPSRAGPDQNLPETGLTFKRVNVLRAIQAVKQLVTAPTPPPTPGAGSSDTNNVVAAALHVPSLTGNQQFVFQGNIGTDGQVQVGANDVDLFSINLASPGVVTFATSPGSGGTSFDGFLRLFNSGGSEIASANNSNGPYPTLQTVRLSAGTYYFGVSSFNNSAYDVNTGTGSANGGSTGDYKLAVSLSNPDINGVASGAEPVDLINPNRIDPDLGVPAVFFGGTIGSDPNPLDPSGPRFDVGPTDVDMFKAVASDNGILTIDVNALGSTHPQDGVDSYLRVFDANLQEVAANDDKSAFNPDSFLQLPVQKDQVYYVAVTTFGNRNFNPTDPFDRTSSGGIGNYDLYLSFANGDVNGTAFSAVDTPFNTNVRGTIGTDNGQPLIGSAEKDVDFFKFKSPSDGIFDISASSPDGTLVLAVGLWEFTSGSSDITKVQDATGPTTRLLAPVSPGQTFYVSVTGQGNNNFKWFAPGSGSGGDTGNYALLATLRPLSSLASLTDNSIQNGAPTTISNGQSEFGTLGSDGGVHIGSADVDLYRFTATRDGTLNVKATAPGESSADPFLRIFDSSGNELAFNDDLTDSTRDAGLSVTVSGGATYYIGVNPSSTNAHDYNALTGAGAAAGTEGDYVLTATESGVAAASRSITFSGKTRAAYTDADGSPVTVSLSGPGVGRVLFTSDGNVDASSIVVTDSTAGSTLSIKGDTSVGDISVSGALKAISARTLDLNGHLSVSGSLSKLQMRNVTAGARIDIGAGAALSAALGVVNDASLNSGEDIRSLKLGQWLNTDGTPDDLAAPSLGALSVGGDFEARLRVGTLGKVSIRGTLRNSEIRSAGSIGAFTAAASAASKIFAGARSDLDVLPGSTSDFSDLSAQIKSISFKSKAAGAFSNTLIAAPTIGKVSLGAVQTSNGGTPFGVSGHFIKSFSANANGSLKQANLSDPSASLQVEDFFVRLV